MPFLFFGRKKADQQVSISSPDIEGNRFLTSEPPAPPPSTYFVPLCPPPTPNEVSRDINEPYTQLLKNQEVILEKLSGWEQQQAELKRSLPQAHQAIPFYGNTDPSTLRYRTRQRRRVWIPVFSYLNALAMLLVLVYSIIKNKSTTGYVVNMSPFNAMLGPSTEVMIQMGAMFTPCMRVSTDFPTSGAYDCPNTTVSGLSMPQWTFTFSNMTAMGHPDQAYRFISALFVHAGVIHYVCNVTVLLCMGAAIERRVNPLRFALAWTVGGMVGFMFGSVFIPDGLVSLGCSGALFGVTALALVDIALHWDTITDPVQCFTKLVLLMALGFACGYAPGFDNFSHLGGFIGGLMTGIVLVQATSPTRTRVIFLWGIRCLALAGLIIMGYFLLNSFYKDTQPIECSWCKYLLCLPVGDMCAAYN